jgi:hypothetical protein
VQPAVAPAGERTGGVSVTATTDAAVASGMMNLRGRYYSEELQATYEIVAVNRKLLLRRPRGVVDTLAMRDATTLTGSGLTLRFTNSGTAFALDGGRVRNIAFVRK